jgi:hypothetical protein
MYCSLKQENEALHKIFISVNYVHLFKVEFHTHTHKKVNMFLSDERLFICSISCNMCKEFAECTGKHSKLHQECSRHFKYTDVPLNTVYLEQLAYCACVCEDHMRVMDN